MNVQIRWSHLRNFNRYLVKSRYFFCNETKEESKTSNLLVKGVRKPFCVEPNLDFTEELSDLEKLHQTHIDRGRQIEIDNLLMLTEKFEEWKTLENEQQQLSWQLAQLEKNESGLKDVEKLKERLAQIRPQLRKLIPVLHECLDLPNDFLPDTPRGDHAVIRSVLEPPMPEPCSHIPLLTKLGLLERSRQPYFCFLQDRALDLMTELEDLCAAKFENVGFHRITTPHLVRKAVLQGCSTDFESYKSLEIADSSLKPDEEAYAPLVLTGQSLASFYALFTRKTVSEPADHTKFPLKYFSQGTAYRPPEVCEYSAGLYATPQYSALTYFVLGRNEDEMKFAFKELKNLIASFISDLNLPLFETQTPSGRLNSAEMARIDFHAYDPSKWGTGSGTGTLPYGFAAFYGDYISKRLRTYYFQKGAKDQDDFNLYAHVAYAKLDMNSVVAAFVERHWNDTKQPTVGQLELDMQDMIK